MKHDPERAAEFFDQFAEREWARFDDDDPTTPSTELDVHLEYLRRYVNAGDRVLDVGAGPGRFTIELANLGATVVVADISPGQLAFNKEKLVEAGRILAQEPQAMQLRYFAALHDIAGERSSTVVFPLPMDLLGHFTARPRE